MLKFTSIKNCCRVCLTQPATSKITSLDPDVSQKLILISGVYKAGNLDELPQYICTKCDSDLDIVHNFIGKVKFSKLQIEKHLQQILKMKKIDPKISNETLKIRRLNRFDVDEAEKTEPETNGQTRSILGPGELQTIEENLNLESTLKSDCTPNLQATPKLEVTANTKLEKVNEEKNLEMVKLKLEGELSLTSKTINCRICDKVFRYKANMQRHIRENHQGIRFTCHFDNCGSSFTQKSSLKMHIGTHTGLKEHKCTVCERYFSQKKSLTAHLRVHSGESPYVCGHCGKAFKQKTNMVRHFKTHCNKPLKLPKRFQCFTCAKYMASKQSLVRHARTHHPEGNLSLN